MSEALVHKGRALQALIIEFRKASLKYYGPHLHMALNSFVMQDMVTHFIANNKLDVDSREIPLLIFVNNTLGIKDGEFRLGMLETWHQWTLPQQEQVWSLVIKNRHEHNFFKALALIDQVKTPEYISPNYIVPIIKNFYRACFSIIGISDTEMTELEMQQFTKINSLLELNYTLNCYHYGDAA